MESIIEENINQVKETRKTLGEFILENKVVIAGGALAMVTYTIGRNQGFGEGYVSGYGRCFRDIADVITKSK